MVLNQDQSIKTISILGSTGSIGCSTIDLIARNPEQFQVIALTGHRNIDKLVEQARLVRPQYICTADPSLYEALKLASAGLGVEIAAGPEAVIEAAQRPADFVMSAIVGAAGLLPTYEAIKRGATIGLANKESLVCAGDLMTQAVAKYGATLLPVDSEHNAIFQVFDHNNQSAIQSITLTASGGPFRTFSKEAMAIVTPEQAVAHPNWSMGAKISIDSATMMNKGLELIEAYHLFPVTEPQIEILVHPQSVIHSMVNYCDGSTLAQLGSPDMRTPIAYSLAWPKRMAAPAPKLDLGVLGQLTFERPDLERFPALTLARNALSAGGGASIILNAANEIAVAAFLKREIGFLSITSIVADCMALLSVDAPQNIDDVLSIDRLSREKAQESIAKKT